MKFSDFVNGFGSGSGTSAPSSGTSGAPAGGGDSGGNDSSSGDVVQRVINTTTASGGNAPAFSIVAGGSVNAADQGGHGWMYLGLGFLAAVLLVRGMK